MDKTPETTPVAPETTAPPVEAPAQKDPMEQFMDKLFAQVKLSPELEAQVEEMKLEAGNIEDVYQKDYRAIRLENLREETDWFQKIFAYCKHFISKQVAGSLKEGFDAAVKPEELEKLAEKVPSIEAASQQMLKEGLGVADASLNTVFAQDRPLTLSERMLAKAFKALEEKPKEGEAPSTSKEQAQKLLESMFLYYPKGGTLVQSQDPERGGFDMKKSKWMKMAFAAMGYKLNIVSPRSAQMASAVGPNEIRIVLVPEGKLPVDETGWNLPMVDQFVALHDKGKTLWHEKELHAMVLVRKGMAVEEALQQSLIQAPTDLALKKQYDTMRSQLEQLSPNT